MKKRRGLLLLIFVIAALVCGCGDNNHNKITVVTELKTVEGTESIQEPENVEGSEHIKELEDVTESENTKASKDAKGSEYIEESSDLKDAGNIIKIVVSCSENDPAVIYRVDFRTGMIEKTIFYEEPEKTEEEYEKQDELKQFVEEKIIPTYGTDDEIESSTVENDEEQKVLWNIKISYEDDIFIFSSFSKYPDYWDELMGLLEE